ncbi:SDR family oxidoreductase [Geodermatophilus sp. SYSU D01036]
MILVVGATGQLGCRVVRLLAAQGRPVRAVVRRPETAPDIAATGAEIVAADLREPETLDAALTGVRCVVATASVIAPTQRGDTHAAEVRGYAELVARAERAGVRRFVYASVPAGPVDEAVPPVRAKRRTEERLAASTLSWASLRLPPFTEVWLALVGSSLPVRAELRPVTSRPFPFLQRFRRLTGRSIDDHGLMLVPGPVSARHAFISVHDVARLMVAAADAHDVDGTVDVGGPEVLTWADVARHFEEVLDRRVRVLSTPAAVYAVAQRALAPVAPAAATVMALDRFMACLETPWDTTELTRRMGVENMSTVAEVLREKAAVPSPT